MRKRRKKKNPVITILLCILCVSLFVGIYFVGSIYIEYNNSAVGSGETVKVEIQQGEGTWDIAKALQEQGLIRHKIAFLLKVYKMEANSQLRYGTFELHENAGLENIIQELIQGGAQREEKMFTVPEGYTIEMIAKKLEAEQICTEAEFLRAVKKEYDYWFLESIPEDADVRYRLQGFLFPDTYAIGEDTTAESIVNAMLTQFGNKYTKKMEKKAEKLGRTTFELITEASLIERETGIDKERKLIAGVIENRLESGMRLQIDPTFLYPITEGLYDIERATYEHRDVESPYNTYKNSGLPVGPIACPGLASIEAALNPAEHNYFYYHTDEKKGDGSHIFTETYEEHVNTQD